MDFVGVMPRGAALLALCGIWVLAGSTSQECPPGGKYLDKHLGENGKMQCCSELCEVKLSIYQNMCRKECPAYEEIKTRDSHRANMAENQLTHKAAGSTSANDGPALPFAVVSVVVPIAVVLAIIIIIAPFVLKRTRGGTFFRSLRRTREIDGQGNHLHENLNEIFREHGQPETREDRHRHGTPRETRPEMQESLLMHEISMGSRRPETPPEVRQNPPPPDNSQLEHLEAALQQIPDEDSVYQTAVKEVSNRRPMQCQDSPQDQNVVVH